MELLHLFLKYVCKFEIASRKSRYPRGDSRQLACALSSTCFKLAIIHHVLDLHPTRVAGSKTFALFRSRGASNFYTLGGDPMLKTGSICSKHLLSIIALSSEGAAA